MARFSWRKKQVRSAQSVGGRSRNWAARQRWAPYIETLEDRCLLDCNATDAASLADCINQVNAGGGGETIRLAAGDYLLPSNLPPIFALGTSVIGPAAATPQAFIEPAVNSFANIGLQDFGGSGIIANVAFGGFTGINPQGVGLILGVNGQDTVQNCYFGFGDNGGIVPLANTVGMQILSGNNNTIGGNMAGQSNVIANNNASGGAIGLEMKFGSIHNQIIGNYIGTDTVGMQSLPNGTGLMVESDNNTIGGTVAGDGNLISGNGGTGLAFSGAKNNLIQGNDIGTQKNGNLPLPNGGVGIDLASNLTASTCSMDPAGNTIGGPFGSPEANLISGNLQGGILMENSDCNLIEGDVIGLNSGGALSIPNTKFGISISAGSFNTIGGANVGNRNIVSGNNGDGVQLSGTANLVEHDRIGTDFAGTSAFPNTGSGVVVANGMGNRIGGTITDPSIPMNLISGNKQSGIQIEIKAVQTMVQGNFIGTDLSGTQPLGNATDPSSGLLLNAGISISGGATNTCVGGTFMGGTVNACLGGRVANNISEYRNVISANQGPDGLAPGVSITGFDTDPLSTTSNNLIAGNFIGTDWSGDFVSYTPDPMTVPPVPLGNGRGVYIWGRATNNVVGDPTPRGATMTFGTRNIIAGNLYDGVAISDRGTSNNNLYDNYIGTDTRGIVGINGYPLLTDMYGVRYGNGEGVDIFNGATANQIGGYIRPDQSQGSVPPDDRDIQSHRNLISGNLREGVRIYDSNTNMDPHQMNLVQGNLIGIYIDPNDNIEKPLVMQDMNGNFIGQTIGVALAGFASNNLIGGTVMDMIGNQPYIINGGNTISGNTIYGVAFHDSRTYFNRVEENMIGSDTSGLKAVVYRVDANTDLTVQPYGVAFYNGAGNAVAHLGNTLGGTTPQSRNIITGNINDGVIIFGTPDPLDNEALPQYNVVLGNYIGTNMTGRDYLKDPYHPLVNVGNGGNGINIYFNAHDNTIGGTGPGFHNLITGNPLDGILIDSEAYNNRIQGNWIGLDSRGLLFQAGPGNGMNGIEFNLGHNDPLPPHDNTIGGIELSESNTIQAGNVISANTLDGILITGGSSNNVIEGNYIGTDTAGELRISRPELGMLGNGTTPDANGVYYNGIHILGAGNDQTTIGGILDGMPNHNPGNTIGFNGNDGILIDGAILNPILSNNIAMNMDPNALGGSGIDSGIDLINGGNDIPTTVHPNPSWLTAVNYMTGPGLLTFTGSVPAGVLAPNTTYILHFFLNSYQPASGLGEGEFFAGGIYLITDASGAAVIDPNDPTNPAKFFFRNLDTTYYQWVTMTLTYPNPNMDPNHLWGDTSDFSENSPTNNVPLTTDMPPSAGKGGLQGIGVVSVPVNLTSVGVTLGTLSGLTTQTITFGSGAGPTTTAATDPVLRAPVAAMDLFFTRSGRGFDPLAHAGWSHLRHHPEGIAWGDFMLEQTTDLSGVF